MTGLYKKTKWACVQSVNQSFLDTISLLAVEFNQVSRDSSCSFSAPNSHRYVTSQLSPRLAAVSALSVVPSPIKTKKLHGAHSPSWEANSHSASQDISGLLWKPPLVPVLTQMHPVHTHPISLQNFVYISVTCALNDQPISSLLLSEIAPRLSSP
jgi:hypothetical protein